MKRKKNMHALQCCLLIFPSLYDWSVKRKKFAAQFVIWQLIRSVYAGPIICGNKDGINQEIFLICSINWWLCPSSYALDWLWASLHTLLASFPSLGFGVLIARTYNRCVAAAVLSWDPKEGTAQRFPEKGIVSLLLHHLV